MNVTNAIEEIEASLYGRKITTTDAQTLIDNLPSEMRLEGLLLLLQNFLLSEVSFSLSEEDDESGLGAELKWLNPDQILDEALLAYPGKAVLKLGYLPIGSCLLGSGDPYFLFLRDADPEDPALVRVPHDFARENENYPEDKIETVSSSLSRFFRLAAIDKP